MADAQITTPMVCCLDAVSVRQLPAGWVGPPWTGPVGALLAGMAKVKACCWQDPAKKIHGGDGRFAP